MKLVIALCCSGIFILTSSCSPSLWVLSSPAQYNYAIVAGNRPLRPGELFEVQIDNLLVQWTGTLSIGITSLPPDEVAQLSSLSECQNSCWMLCSKGVTCQGAVRYPGASRFMQDVKVLL